MKNSSKGSFHAIGFAVYEAKPNMNRITPQFVAENVCGGGNNNAN